MLHVFPKDKRPTSSAIRVCTFTECTLPIKFNFFIDLLCCFLPTLFLNKFHTNKINTWPNIKSVENQYAVFYEHLKLFSWFNSSDIYIAEISTVVYPIFFGNANFYQVMSIGSLPFKIKLLVSTFLVVFTNSYRFNSSFKFKQQNNWQSVCTFKLFPDFYVCFVSVFAISTLLSWSRKFDH